MLHVYFFYVIIFKNYISIFKRIDFAEQYSYICKGILIYNAVKCESYRHFKYNVTFNFVVVLFILIKL